MMPSTARAAMIGKTRKDDHPRVRFSANLPKFAMQYGSGLIALALVCVVSPLEAQPANNGDKKDDQVGALESVPLQINQPIKGLQFPSYDAHNKLQMMLNADVATKVDPTHIELQNMKIDATGDDGKIFHVELPYSVFEVNRRVLTGDKGVLIKRDDFQITGDAGEFYLKTRFAKVLNNVKMIVFALPATPTSSPIP